MWRCGRGWATRRVLQRKSHLAAQPYAKPQNRFFRPSVGGDVRGLTEGFTAQTKLIIKVTIKSTRKIHEKTQAQSHTSQPEPVSIWMDSRLNKSPLKGRLGDALDTVMCGLGYDTHLLLSQLRPLCAQFGIASQELLQVILLLQQANCNSVV